MTDAAIIKAACVQMTSGPDIQSNLKQAGSYIREAAGQGATLIATPENTCHIRHPPEKKLETAPEEKVHPALPFFSALAKELGITLLIGSLSVRVAGDKIANRSYLFSDAGEVLASYDKIHLFDITLPGGEVHRESAVVRPGERAVTADTPAGRLGLSICYDVRFAYLYRDLARAGVQILMVPSAFTVPTGRAHWEVLLRARAIETGSFVMAPAQTGEHENGRRTWGHSMIISPWGEILAQGGEDKGVIMAGIHLSHVDKARRSIPALQHDRSYISGQ